MGAAADAVVASPLVWDNERLELHPGLEAYRDGKVEARFPLANTGTSTWEILAVEPDCGCTLAELTKRTLAPGECGEIVASFTVAERTGRNEKHLLVRASSDPNGEVQVVARLTLIINLPALVRITPEKVSWTLGEASTPKTLVVEAAFPEMPLHRVWARSTQALFKPEVTTVEPGRRYEVTVTPMSTEILLTGHLPISCEFAPNASAESNAIPAQPAPANAPRIYVTIADIVPPTSASAKTAAAATKTAAEQASQ